MVGGVVVGTVGYLLLAAPLWGLGYYNPPKSDPFHGSGSPGEIGIFLSIVTWMFIVVILLALVLGAAVEAVKWAI